MAIYHLRLKVHSRDLGRAARPGGATCRSVVAAAAYRSGERLYDARQGKWFEFDKPDVIHTEIMSPVNQEVAPWVFDRQELWNRVEASEKRVDAQLAREVEITLPRELTKEQQVELVGRFVRDQFVSKGMVADVAIHRPLAADGLDQPHAHILLTLRRLDASSPTGFAATKERDWNEREDIARAVAEARKRFNDTGLPADHAALEAAEARRNVHVWRREWAAYANQALADAGSEARIDHRTLERQGIFRVAEISLGIARHIEKAYDYLKERITQWVAIKKRADLYEEVEHYKQRDPVKLTDFVLQLADMAEGFAASFRKPSQDIPEVPLDR
ncbi:MAG: MobQ family relaxase [Asticcacaulis sp.]|uniref:MobQ family relaxase n=1 Tax=Asticcacaulis sp. TaxID=1872648 RepID=UPI0039E31E1D